MNTRSLRRSTVLFVAITAGIAGCDGAPTEPVGLATGRPALAVVPQVFQSGSHVKTWDPILQTLPSDEDWTTTICTANPLVGLDAAWQNPHNAFVLGHPWMNDYFSAPWINAWSDVGSAGSGGSYPHYNWTKYSTEVEGDGSFVIRLLADNCSWIYLDGTLVGVQGTDLSKNSYGLTLNGKHTLEFVIFDGGGLAGGKFILETTTNPPPPLNNDLDADGHPNTSDAFPLDPTEWADTDGDGTGDNGDAFPNDPTEQVDSDGDGVGDNGDAYPNDPTRTSLDADGDGVEDGADNCPAVANANQADQDNDSVGDACDPDVDGDGVVNGADAFPTDPAESADSDGDGLGDHADGYDQSNAGPVLLVGTCNTGVANWHVGSGTYANDLIAAARAAAANHGKFVSAVSELTNAWKKAGLITGQQQGQIVSCAARTK